MGGRIVMTLAARRPELLEAIVVVDTPVPEPGAADDAPIGQPRRGGRVFPTLDEAHGAFRLLPPQRFDDDRLLVHIADGAIREVDGGWSFKADGRVFARWTHAEVHDALARLEVPMAMIRGADSRVMDAASARVAAALSGLHVPLEEIEGAGHHVPLDAPAALGASVRAWAERWLRSP
jgi:pimeloyl-ACP methyl ester carboxylesterase